MQQQQQQQQLVLHQLLPVYAHLLDHSLSGSQDQGPCSREAGGHTLTQCSSYALLTALVTLFS